MKKIISSNRNKGFTMMELLVAVFVFGLIFSILALIVKFSSGRVESDKYKDLTRSLRSSYDTIMQKSANPTEKITLVEDNNSIWGIEVFRNDGARYGSKFTSPNTYFPPISDGILGIATMDGGNNCHFIKRDNDKLVAKTIHDCSDGLTKEDVSTGFDQVLTSGDIKISEFILSGSTACPFTPGINGVTPFVKVSVSAVNKNDENIKAGFTATIVQTYTEAVNLCQRTMEGNPCGAE